MKRLILAVLVVCGAPVSAQQQPTSIPKDLVVLMMRGVMMPADEFDIVLGAPANFPAELLPRGAKPLISTTTRTNVMVVAEVRGDMAGYEKQMAAAGWTVSPRSGMQQRGLVAAAPPTMPAMWCRADKYASVSVSPRPAGGSIVRIGLNDTSRGNPCDPMGTPSYNSMQSDVEMPLLFPPPGSRAIGGGYGGGGMDSYDQRLRLETKLTLPQVLQHYRAQVEAHGWKFQSQALADGLGVARFDAVSTKKEPVTATLSVNTAPGEPPLEITLHVVRAPYRPFLP
jgi:hypothetical protein